MRGVLYTMRSTPESNQRLNEYTRAGSGRLASDLGNPTHGQCSEHRDEDQKNTTFNGNQEFKSTILILVLHEIGQQPGTEMEQHRNSKKKKEELCRRAAVQDRLYASRSPFNSSWRQGSNPTKAEFDVISGEEDQHSARYLCDSGRGYKLEVCPSQRNPAPLSIGGLVLPRHIVEGAVSGLLAPKIRFDDNPPE
ncbi:hypothetical protein B0H14DRAFT_2579365 [Mycena olivaceomarginata]|nr:hypothetical protein B0H14DRAFT_2579365 [Mycena olivaceomarginata]